jgi:hypothetical protein
VLPLDERIVHERLEHAHQRVLVLAQDPHRHLARLAVHACMGETIGRRAVSVDARRERSQTGDAGQLTLDTCDSEAVNLVRRETEWDALLDLKGSALVCDARKSAIAPMSASGRSEAEADLLEETVKIDMNSVSCVRVVQRVLAVSVSESIKSKAEPVSQLDELERRRRKLTRAQSRPCT